MLVHYSEIFLCKCKINVFAACVTELVTIGGGAHGMPCVGCIGEIISVGEFDNQYD